MRLTITCRPGHSEICVAVTWSPDSTLFSCSDDKAVLKWSSDGEAGGKVGSIETFMSSIAWFPGIGKQAPDMFALSCTDGTLRFISRSGREEKKIAAHEGAAIVVKWSHDGAAILTAGEDGDVKIWSKNGNLRSTLASTGRSVYCACWGPDDDQVLIGTGKVLMIKTVQATKKNLQWNAHEGIVTCVDWNIANGNILSGGEDCTYRIWDSYGRQLYCSRPMENVVTSLGWSPNGECFAVGSYNLLRLCDRTGWTHSRERVVCGSIMNMAWTSDSTQLAGAGGDGSVIFAQVVDRRVEWKNHEATLISPRRIRVADMANEAIEELEFAKDRVVEMGMGFDHLIVATSCQCYIYAIQNLNTPTIFDMKAPPHFLHLSKKHFLTLDHANGVQISSYEGRVLSSPKYQGLRPEYLTRELVALSPDTVAIVDTVGQKVVHLFDATSGKEIGKVTHSVELAAIGLNQHNLGPQERLLVFTDKNLEFFISALSTTTSAKGPVNFSMYKLQTHIESFMFNDETDMLVGIADGKLAVWCHPAAMFVDKDLLPLSSYVSESTDFGRNAKMVSYTGTKATVRKVDGSLIFAATVADVNLLYDLSRADRWDHCVRLCRLQGSSVLWGSLASMSLLKRQLDTAITALAELNEVVKVEYLQFVQAIPSEEGRNAELALFRRQPDEAERILLQASPSLVYRAIKMNIRLYRWARALELAKKHKTHVDTVLLYRKNFLEDLGKTETDKMFTALLSEVPIDVEAIKAKEHRELDDERSRGKGGGPNHNSRK